MIGGELELQEQPQQQNQYYQYSISSPHIHIIMDEHDADFPQDDEDNNDDYNYNYNDNDNSNENDNRKQDGQDSAPKKSPSNSYEMIPLDPSFTPTELDGECVDVYCLLLFVTQDSQWQQHRPHRIIGVSTTSRAAAAAALSVICARGKEAYNHPGYVAR